MSHLYLYNMIYKNLSYYLIKLLLLGERSYLFPGSCTAIYIIYKYLSIYLYLSNLYLSIYLTQLVLLGERSYLFPILYAIPSLDSALSSETGYPVTLRKKYR